MLGGVSTRAPKGDGSVFLRADGFWYFMHSYQTPEGRKRIPKCLGKHPNKESALEAARKAKREVQPELVRREREHRIGASKYQTATCDPLLTQYIASLKRRKAASAYVIEKCIEAHVRPFFGSLKVLKLDTKIFDEYRAERTGQDGVSNATVDHDLTYLSAALRLEHNKRPNTRVPVMPTIPKSGEDHVRQNFLAFDGYQRVLEALPASLKCLFVIGWHIGNRKSALLELEWAQIEATTIRFHRKQGGKPVAVHGPIYGDMREWLEKQRSVRDRLFPKCQHVFFWHPEDCQIGGHGGSRSVPGARIVDFRESWSKAVRAAGYPDLLFHDLRRSAVRNMIEKVRMSEKRAMEISGHLTTSMLHRYNIQNPSDVEDSARRMDQWIKDQRAEQARGQATERVKDNDPTSLLDRLERCADLRRQNMITDEEFQAIKSSLLAKSR